MSSLTIVFGARQSGKTRRLYEIAIQRAREGKCVRILDPTRRMSDMARLVVDCCLAEPTPKSLHLVPVTDNDIAGTTPGLWKAGDVVVLDDATALRIHGERATLDSLRLFARLYGVHLVTAMDMPNDIDLAFEVLPRPAGTS